MPVGCARKKRRRLAFPHRRPLVQPRLAAQRRQHLGQQPAPMLLLRLARALLRLRALQLPRGLRLRRRTPGRQAEPNPNTALLIPNLSSTSQPEPPPPFTFQISPLINPASGVQRNHHRPGNLIHMPNPAQRNQRRRLLRRLRVG